MARAEGLMAPVQAARVPLTPEPRLRRLWRLLATFLSNVVERFHELADARLAEELTIAEQRRRLLSGKVNAS